MVKVLGRFQTQWEAGLVIAFLRQNGFHPMDLSVWPHITFAGADQTYSLSVPEDEFEEARNLLRKSGYEKGLESE